MGRSDVVTARITLDNALGNVQKLINAYKYQQADICPTNICA